MKREEPPAPQIPLFERSPEKATPPADESRGPTSKVPLTPHVFSVTELTLLVKGQIEERFGRVWVEGEISGYRSPNAAGHIYCTLKDAGAALSIVLFKRRASAMKFALREGLQVIAKGALEVYPPHGRYQLIVEEIEPKGEGARQLALRQLKERLDREGLFAAARKRSIPLLPRRVGVVTSQTGAAFRDIVQVVSRRFPTMPIRLSPATVQGEGAAVSIAQSLARLDACDDLDVIIVGRGGGSVEDLWAFNEEVVLRAIAACRHPVIAAVGHEIDVTLSDLVADVRAPTPSAAAELAVPVRSDLVATVANLSGRALRALRREIGERRHAVLTGRAKLGDPLRRLRDGRLAVDDSTFRAQRAASTKVRALRRRLSDLSLRVGRQHPRSALARLTERLAALRVAGRVSMRKRLDVARAELRTVAVRLDALSPLAVLGRGYAIAQTVDGRAVRRAGDVALGDSLTVRVHEGTIACRVEETKK